MVARFYSAGPGRATFYRVCGDGWGCFSPLLGVWCRARLGREPAGAGPGRAAERSTVEVFGSPLVYGAILLCVRWGAGLGSWPTINGGCGPALGGLIVDKLSPWLRRSRR